MADKLDGQKMPTSNMGSALTHIADRGHLHAFAMPPSEKQALMRTAIREGLMVWSKELQRYELTTIGRERLAEYRHQTATDV
jgi:hypothetical protein